MKKAIPLPAWLPDQSANSGGLNVASNVLPRIDGYGPAKDFVGAADALPAAFSGAISCIGVDGASVMLVGTTEKLRLYNSGAWDNLGAVAIASPWKFAQFGNHIIGVNGAVTKDYDISTGTVSTLAGAPSGQCIAIVGDYVVIGQAANDKLGIFTSGFNDHTVWDFTDPLTTATYQPMLTGGEVMGLAGGEYGIILQRQRLVRMNRTGDKDAPFSYDEITPNIGCASKGSIAQAGRTVFFLSDQGFAALQDGQTVTRIGSEKVDRYFQGRVTKSDYDRLYAAVDPSNKLVFWCVPGSTGFLLVYHYELDRWSQIELGCDGIFPGFTENVTLDEVSALYPDIDAMPYSFDDPRWSGGVPRLYVVKGGVLGTLTGDTLEAAFEYSFNTFTPGYVTRFRAMRPITDALDGQVLTLDVRARFGDSEGKVFSGTLRTSGIMPVRCSGRYAKPAWTIEAGAKWTFAQGIEFEFEQGGER